MVLENIIEKRIVNKGKHSLVLEMTSDAFKKLNYEYSDEIAAKIVNQHLYNTMDDGKASEANFEISDNNLIRIYADISYVGNTHTNYGIH